MMSKKLPDDMPVMTWCVRRLGDKTWERVDEKLRSSEMYKALIKYCKKIAKELNANADDLSKLIFDGERNGKWSRYFFRGIKITRSVIPVSNDKKVEIKIEYCNVPKSCGNMTRIFVNTNDALGAGVYGKMWENVYCHVGLKPKTVNAIKDYVVEWLQLEKQEAQDD
jgi:hypothetical protein